MEIQLGFIIVGFIIGFFLLIGTIFRLKILVDPPEEWASFYSHSKLKELFGAGFLVGFNYFLGISFLFFSIIFLIYFCVGE